MTLIRPQGMAPAKKWGVPLWFQVSVSHRWSRVEVSEVIRWGPGGTPPPTHTCNHMNNGIRPGLYGAAIVHINYWGAAPGPVLASGSLQGYDVCPYSEPNSCILSGGGLP